MCGALGLTPPSRDLNVLTALSARAGVTSSLVQGEALLLLPAEEALSGPPEHTHPRHPHVLPGCQDSGCL